MINRRVFARIAVFGLVAAAAAVVLVAKSNSLTVKLRDDCNPKTFNAALGNGACVGHGETTFAEFNAEFAEDHRVDDWEMSPDSASVQTGATVQVSNRGGETHTFTKVAHFGGGFVPQLNGNMVARPECAQAPGVPQPPGPGNIFVPSGATVNGPTAGGVNLPSGQITKFQCCIHPWMRIEIAAR
jgi:hypothetical protein